MVKIEPTTSVILNKVKNISREKVKTGVTNPEASRQVAAAAVLAGTATVSTFLKDFKKSVDDNNYFQLKIDPNTGKPFKPDLFQTAAAMNLYLGNDVLVTAPTGTGKTAIAEYIISKNIKDGGVTYYTTPLKALSNEKFKEFKKLYGDDNVGLITGDNKINPTANVVVMTTEVYRNMVAAQKFNFTKDIDIGIPDNLRTVIFDELQYLGDIDRGGIWEQSIMFTPQKVQILSLSATIGNNVTINNWIASVKGRKGITADLKEKYMPNQSPIRETVLIDVPSENRHVPLSFQIEPVAAEIKIPKGLNKKERGKAAQEGARISQSIYAKPSHSTYKTLTRKLKELDKLPAIYFIFSKKECRNILNELVDSGDILTTEVERKAIKSILKEYEAKGIYLGETLNEAGLLKGYALHNAGLLPSQKSLVEELFQKKLIKVVLATETLSAGINMPARTTVIATPRKPTSTPDGGEDRKRNLTANEFHQMAGRGGRRGIDKNGYNYSLACNNAQKEIYETLIESPSNPLSSNLDLDYSFITTYMSEFIDEGELKNILSKSLYVYDGDVDTSSAKLNELMERYSIRRKILEDENYITPDGKLTLKGQLIKKLNGYEQIPIINIIHNKLFKDLDAVQIAGVIAGLANIKYYTGDDYIERNLEMRKNRDIEFLCAAREAHREVQKYEGNGFKLFPDREMYLDAKIMDFTYNWADFNYKGYAPRDNWKYLYNGSGRYSTKEEGALFKELSMTVDLMKQLLDVTDIGEFYSETDDDKNYYVSLRSKLQQAIDLIQQEPLSKDSN